MLSSKFKHRPPSTHLSALSFSSYTTEDVVRLSVKRLTEVECFDPLGHPNVGGLYDPALGPVDSTSQCATCGLQYFTCPGHMGHIWLPLPVFNPVYFMALIMPLMKGGCVFCHRLFCGKFEAQTRLFLLQLRLIDAGRLGAARRLKARLGAAPNDVTNAQLYAEWDEWENFVNGELAKAEAEGESGKWDRNVVKERKSMVDDFCKRSLFKRMVKCPHCGKKSPTVKNVFHRYLALDFGTRLLNRRGQHQKFATDETATDELEALRAEVLATASQKLGIEAQLESVLNGRTAQLIWGAIDVRDHLRLLFANDRRVLEALFPLFSAQPALAGSGVERVETHGLCATERGPVDVLFMEALPVSGSKWRPTRCFDERPSEHRRTTALRRVMEQAQLVHALIAIMNGSTDSKHEVCLLSTIGIV